ncbi:hypothetical protein [Dapis sp. BLCC M229]|uniref:hypothetical protein n=1 Tax=Dapis sp. BLCC M229 TaxID=3400188 RepID=UPI003CE84591
MVILSVFIGLGISFGVIFTSIIIPNIKEMVVNTSPTKPKSYPKSATPYFGALRFANAPYWTDTANFVHYLERGMGRVHLIKC